MFIRYNEVAKWWEYDSAIAKDGKGPWIKLPIDYTQIYNLPSVPPASLPPNIAYKNVINQFTQKQRINNAGGDLARITFSDLSQAVDRKVWEINLLSENLNIWGLNDAESAVVTSFVFNRAGGFSVFYISIGSSIIFPSAQAAQSNPNALDDYEEGTWLPTFASASGGVGTGYGNQSGSYTKIGNLVYVSYDIGIASASWTSGLLVMSLPFLNDGYFIMGAVGYFVNMPVNLVGLYHELDPNNNVVYFNKKVAASSGMDGALQVTELVAGSRLLGNLVYRTTT